MALCSVCGIQARYSVVVQVYVMDDAGERPMRQKGINLHLCDEHEVCLQHFLQRDAEQANRVAAGIAPQWKREHVWDHFRPSPLSPLPGGRGEE